MKFENFFNKPKQEKPNLENLETTYRKYNSKISQLESGDIENLEDYESVYEYLEDIKSDDEAVRSEALDKASKVLHNELEEKIGSENVKFFEDKNNVDKLLSNLSELKEKEAELKEEDMEGDENLLLQLNQSAIQKDEFALKNIIKEYKEDKEKMDTFEDLLDKHSLSREKEILI